MNGFDIALSLAALVLGAAVQAVTGFGFALLAIPVIALNFHPAVAIVVASLAGGVLTANSMWRDRRYISVPHVTVVCLAAFAGMPVGVAVLLLAPERVVTGLVAVVVLISTALLYRGVRLPRGRQTEISVGLLSGALMTSTGINGPPLVIAFQSQGMAPRIFRASLAAVFTAQRIVAIVLIALAGKIGREALVLSALGIPAVLLGWEAGNGVFQRLDAARFRTVVLCMLMLSGLAALVSAVFE